MPPVCRGERGEVQGRHGGAEVCAGGDSPRGPHPQAEDEDEDHPGALLHPVFLAQGASPHPSPHHHVRSPVCIEVYVKFGGRAGLHPHSAP